MARGKRNNPELRAVQPTNDLNDEQKAVLFGDGLEVLEEYQEQIDALVAKKRNQRKIMKSEGFSAAEIDYALWVRKKGEEAAKDAMAMNIRVAAWLGKPLGFQAALDI